MTTPATPSNSKPTGDDRTPAAANVAGFDEQLQGFWGKNRSLIIGVCALVLVAILAKGGMDYLGRQKDLDVQKAFAAATTPEQINAFIAAHPGHPLSGIAYVRMADEAYTANKISDAIANYDKAIGVLKDGPLAARAKLGRAVSKVQAGQTAEATTELKQLADDTTQFNTVRAEAIYSLARLAATAGKGDEVQSYAMQLMQLDPQSPWSMRAMSLRAEMPASATPAAAPAIPAAGEAKKDEAAAPSVELKLPSK